MSVTQKNGQQKSIHGTSLMLLNLKVARSKRSLIDFLLKTSNNCCDIHIELLKKYEFNNQNRKRIWKLRENG